MHRFRGLRVYRVMFIISTVALVAFIVLLSLGFIHPHRQGGVGVRANQSTLEGDFLALSKITLKLCLVDVKSKNKKS